MLCSTAVEFRSKDSAEFPLVTISSPDVLVVEGANDTKAVMRALSCECIETGGMALIPALSRIRNARDRARVFVFTDSDPAGLRIRREIHERVKHCLDARLPVSEIHPRASVESASPEQILSALRVAGFRLAVRLTNHLCMKAQSFQNGPIDPLRVRAQGHGHPNRR